MGSRVRTKGATGPEPVLGPRSSRGAGLGRKSHARRVLLRRHPGRRAAVGAHLAELAVDLVGAGPLAGAPSGRPRGARAADGGLGSRGGPGGQGGLGNQQRAEGDPGVEARAGAHGDPGGGDQPEDGRGGGGPGPARGGEDPGRPVRLADLALEGRPQGGRAGPGRRRRRARGRPRRAGCPGCPAGPPARAGSRRSRSGAARRGDGRGRAGRPRRAAAVVAAPTGRNSSASSASEC